MANLTVYTDRSVRSAAAKQFLTNLEIVFDEVNVDTTPEAVTLLESQGRDLKHYPLPQFYVGETLAWANGYKDVAGLNADQINERISEINAS